MVVWPWRRASRNAERLRDAQAEAPRWAELGSYAGHFDAAVDRSVLEAEGIPVLVKGSVTGLFGPGFSGPTSEGIRLYVPHDRLEYAQTLLAGEDGE